MTDDREPFREARAAGLQKRHEQRLENATYTAAEVKVLTEEACRVAAEAGRRVGRKEALEDAEAAIKAWRDGDDSTREFRLGLGSAAKIVRDMASEVPA